MSEERCISCGAEVPEGRMVCTDCEERGEEIIRALSKRIRILEETVQHRETTIRLMLADAAAEAEKEKEKEEINSMLGNLEMSELYRHKAEERRRAAERAKSICQRRGIDFEKR